MKTLLGLCWCAAGLLLIAPLYAADDTVTISRERLRELEQKEAELKRLQGAPGSPIVAPSAPAVSTPSTFSAPAPPVQSAPAPSAPAVPALGTLPPLQAGEVVDAAVLAAHYQSDPSAAALRYGNKRIRVRGDVINFDRTIMTRSYTVAVKTADPHVRVVGEFRVPDGYDAVYTIEQGSQLVGYAGKAEIPLAKVGNTITMEGVCKGFKGNTLTLGKARLSF